MKVILLQNIKGTGLIGEVKNVSDGYGRNFLIAKGLAKIATDGAIKESEAIRRKAEVIERIQQGRAKELVESLKDTVVEIKRKASEKGTLFEGIEAMDIAQALSKHITFEVAKDMVHLEAPIKRVGKHTVEIELAPGVKTSVVIDVVKSE